MSKVVVADSSCLIGLARIGRLTLLQQVFGEILISPAVFRETVTNGKGRAGSAEIAASAWIRTVPVKNTAAVLQLSVELGAGESESIVLAEEQRADFLILDDGIARTKATSRQLSVVGTVAVLTLAEKKGVIPGASALVQELRYAGFWFEEGETT